MPYTTKTELERLLPDGVLVDLAPTDPEVDSAIAHAEATIDAYLAGRYSVPFTTPPNAIATCAADLAAYRILCRGPQRSDEFLVFRQKAEDWMGYLIAVGKSELSLPGAGGAGTERGAVTNNGEVTVHFDEETLAGYFDKPKRKKGDTL